ncbi:hypothetical protein MBANPS3_000158 [Mucor bainieri]
MWMTDPKYAKSSLEERTVLIHQFTERRCRQTLSFLRPLNVSGVGKYFVEQGWICDDTLSTAVADALKRFAQKEPKKAEFLFRTKLNPSDDDGKAGADADMSDAEEK